MGAGSGEGSSKPWGGRFEEEQSPLFERLNASIPFDHVLAPYDLKGSQAHVRMLAGIGVLTENERDTILEALVQVAREVEEGSFTWSLKDEDIHMAIERRLTEIAGAVGGMVHTGRSRNDQVALDLQLYLRDAVSGHQRRLRNLMGVLLGQAEEGRDVIFPGYTHLQRAQPILLAHHLLAYVFMLERDWDRFASWVKSSWMPLGAGALAGVNYPSDRKKVASELGFERVALNAMDAVASRDAAFEYLADAANCGLTLSRLAEELVLWTSQEFNFAALPESWSSGSSIMPQKRNPSGAELVRAKTAGFLARLQGLGVVLKGLPLAYDNDLQEDKLYVFGTREELDLCLDAMAAMVGGLSFHPEVARAAAEGSYSQATDVADYLVEKGLPFREAHRISGRLVAKLAAEGRPFADAGMEELTVLSPLFDEGYYEVVKLERVIAAKRSPGGTSPSSVAEQLRIARDVLNRLDSAAG
ncbi:MAG: argininosuccinate lyase [Actinobacteria bacterium]|nr:argininosuccinate lyase [Actinomycetota bacterium]MCL5735583.1 argininosuccinate lyase [Actinomycetota bacterium]